MFFIVWYFNKKSSAKFIDCNRKYLEIEYTSKTIPKPKDNRFTTIVIPTYQELLLLSLVTYVIMYHLS